MSGVSVSGRIALTPNGDLRTTRPRSLWLRIAEAVAAPRTCGPSGQHRRALIQFIESDHIKAGERVRAVCESVLSGGEAGVVVATRPYEGAARAGRVAGRCGQATERTSTRVRSFTRSSHTTHRGNGRSRRCSRAAFSPAGSAGSGAVQPARSARCSGRKSASSRRRGHEIRAMRPPSSHCRTCSVSRPRASDVAGDFRLRSGRDCKVGVTERTPKKPRPRPALTVEFARGS